MRVKKQSFKKWQIPFLLHCVIWRVTSLWGIIHIHLSVGLSIRLLVLKKLISNKLYIRASLLGERSLKDSLRSNKCFRHFVPTLSNINVIWQNFHSKLFQYQTQITNFPCPPPPSFPLSLSSLLSTLFFLSSPFSSFPFPLRSPKPTLTTFQSLCPFPLLFLPKIFSCCTFSE